MILIHHSSLITSSPDDFELNVNVFDGMRILWVKAGKLLPVDTGGKIRSYNLLRELAARHETVLLSYYGGERDRAYEEEIEKHLPGAVTVHTGAPEANAFRQGLDYLRRAPMRAPYAVTKFTSKKVRGLISEWMSSGRFEVAVCDFLSASLNFPDVLKTPTVLFQHNVESALWQRQAQHAPDFVRGMAFRMEAAKMLSYERATVRRFHHVIAVSEHDREQMMSMTDATRITVVPTGVDIKKYAADKDDSRLNRSLVIFLGSMDWEPNIDGVEYFCREVWPQVRKRVPGAIFRIVGRNPHPQVKKLASDTVEVTGSVPSVVEHLREAAVVVVPLRIGGGTRLKIFEAMATGKAVVSTTIGAEGLDVHHGRDILLADDAQSFGNSIIALLSDEEQRKRFERAASELAAQYDWERVARRFEEVLARVTHLPEAAPHVESLPAAVKA